MSAAFGRKLEACHRQSHADGGVARADGSCGRRFERLDRESIDRRVKRGWPVSRGRDNQLFSEQRRGWNGDGPPDDHWPSSSKSAISAQKLT